MRKRTVPLVIAAVLAVSGGCATTSASTDGGVAAPRLTPGLVQRDVHPGMDAARLAEVLGSPNIVTRDAGGREVWVYDRVSTVRVERARSAGLYAFGIGYPGPGAVGGAGHASGSDRTVRTTQRTLTVVVRLDEAARVVSVTLHASQF